MQRITLLLRTVVLIAVSFASAGCVECLWPPAETLDGIAGTVEADLNAMAADLGAAAAAISQTGLDSDDTRETLATLCGQYPAVVDCSTISTAGILVAVEPEEYRDAEGADVSDQEQVIQVLQTGEPVMSSLFTAVEGFPAMDFEYPLPGEGEALGSVSMLLRPADYFAGLIEPLIEGTGDRCMVLQLDGVILYDVDPDQVGRNTFTDPMYAEYPDLLRLAHSCVENPTGIGAYQFTDDGTGELVTRYARWTTVAFYGQEWRILLIGQ